MVAINEILLRECTGEECGGDNDICTDSRVHHRGAENRSPVTRNHRGAPSPGCWMEQDPAQYINGANTYQFVNSSPTGNVDAEGLFTTYEKQYKEIGHTIYKYGPVMVQPFGPSNYATQPCPSTRKVRKVYRATEYYRYKMTQFSLGQEIGGGMSNFGDGTAAVGGGILLAGSLTDPTVVGLPEGATAPGDWGDAQRRWRGDIVSRKCSVLAEPRAHCHLHPLAAELEIPETGGGQLNAVAPGIRVRCRRHRRKKGSVYE